MIVDSDCGLEVCTICSALYHAEHSCNCSWSGAFEPFSERTFVPVLEPQSNFDRIDDRIELQPRTSRYVFGSCDTLVLSA